MATGCLHSHEPPLAERDAFMLTRTIGEADGQIQIGLGKVERVVGRDQQEMKPRLGIGMDGETLA